MTDPLTASRADFVDTGDPRQCAARIIINAPAARIFEILARPPMHALIDGSGTVRGRSSGPARLSLGAKFGMGMRLKVPYRVTNEVMEFDEGSLIAWSHLSGHRWRYELKAIDASTTEVTETFDGRTARLALALKVMNAYANNQVAMARTLVRLKALAESDSLAF